MSSGWCKIACRKFRIKTLSLRKKVRQLTNEIDEIKTTNAILEFNKDDEVSTIQRKFQEEIASMQHITKGK